MGFLDLLLTKIVERVKSLIGGIAAIFLGSVIMNLTDNIYIDVAGLILFLAGIAAIFYGLGLEDYIK